ncbi:MAG: hypothetical protein LBQ06_03050, partial [Frankiaceae bacterium]|nr:hypothetical protein [Frankiaceae bacterium]
MSRFSRWLLMGLVTFAVLGLVWWILALAKVSFGTAGTIAGVAAAVALTAGAVWAERARDTSPGPSGDEGESPDSTVVQNPTGPVATVGESPGSTVVQNSAGPVANVGGSPDSPVVQNPTGPVVNVGGSPGSQVAQNTTGPVVNVGGDAHFGVAPPAAAEPPIGEPAETVRVGNLPLEPRAFQPRADLVGRLARADAPRVSLLCAAETDGAGPGIGKTAVAAAYARQRAEQGWRLVAWVDAATSDLLQDGLAQIARDARWARAGDDIPAAAGRVR